MPDKRTFHDWLRGVDPRLRPIASGLRDKILEADPGLEESIKWGNPCFTGKSRVFYIASQADRYVTLGLWHGALQPNPEGLIEGTGKRMRHVKLRDAESLASPALPPIIARALALDQQGMKDA